MIRRLNYTNRRRIEHKDVAIRLLEPDRGPARVAVTLTLDHYHFPPNARVFVEAYRQTTFQRFDFGTVANLQPPPDLSLVAFGSTDGVRFRIKVVETDAGRDDACPARILGRADSIRPRSAAPRPRQSMLPVVPGDFDDEVWRLEFDEADMPVLAVSRQLVSDWRALPEMSEFLTLAIPAIFRQILTRIVLVERCTSAEDGHDWRAQWIRFATKLVGEPPPVADHSGGLDDWIDQAVSGLCRRIRLAQRFRRWQENEI